MLPFVVFFVAGLVIVPGRVMLPGRVGVVPGRVTEFGRFIVPGRVTEPGR